MKIIKLLLSRMTVTIVIIAIQVIWLLFLWLRLLNYYTIISSLTYIFSLLVVLYIVRKDDNPSYKIPWIILILSLPLIGGLLYIFFGTKRPQRKMVKKLQDEHERIKGYYAPNKILEKEIKEDEASRAGLISYLQNDCRFPLHDNTYTKYYPVGEKMYADMLEELKKAKDFIFIEYFIIANGSMWDGIHEILKDKVKEGVDVRIIYDDIGSLALIEDNFNKIMEDEGIKCIKFNPFVPFISLIMNNRDHRKIMVIDGKVAFNGGINIGDEYINAIEVHGHWKDTGIKLEGDGVNNFTVMFLEMWNAFRFTDEDYSKFYVNHEEKGEEGYVLPFSDSPVDREFVAQNVYLDIINKSENYVYIFTPYLIIDDEMKNALCFAAKRGVDVKLITPGIGDKRIIHSTTRSYYNILIKNGVEIYEYTPGFVHAKSYVSDDEIGVVGTINMDFRSLFLHFECGTLLYKTKSIMTLKEDFLETLTKCEKITEDTYSKGYLTNSIIRLFAPLM